MTKRVPYKLSLRGQVVDRGELGASVGEACFWGLLLALLIAAGLLVAVEQMPPAAAEAQEFDLPELVIHECLPLYKHVGVEIMEIEADYNAAVDVINRQSDRLFGRLLATRLTDAEMLRRETVMCPPFSTVSECQTHLFAARETYALREAHFLAACDTIALLAAIDREVNQ